MNFQSWGRTFIISLLILFFISIDANAQNFNCKIEGYVNAQSSGNPLENVNVYVSGTTFGTTTDKSGYFRFKSLPSGTLNIIASMVGYKPEHIEVTLEEDKTKELNFKLKEISYELNKVVVTGKVPEEWKENLEEFKSIFFGDSPFASECKIVNPEIINLTKTDSNLIAETDQPVIILNNDLGYKITCYLINFNWNKDDGVLKYLIESYFTELKDSTGNLTSKWIRNRKKAYYGSLNDFLKSLIKNDLEENDFTIFCEKKPSIRTAYQEQVNESEICSTRNNGFNLNFSDYLRIEYHSEYEGITKISWIKLQHPDVILDKFGYPLDPFAFNVYGYWSHKGIANMLPKYYYP
jgi:hypothetical protein